MYFGGFRLSMGYLHSHDPQTQSIPNRTCMDPQEQSSPCVPCSKDNVLCCWASQKTEDHLDFSFSLSPCIKSLHLFTQTPKYLLNPYNSVHPKAECWGHITTTPSSCYLNTHLMVSLSHHSPNCSSLCKLFSHRATFLSLPCFNLFTGFFLGIKPLSYDLHVVWALLISLVGGVGAGEKTGLQTDTGIYKLLQMVWRK